MDGLCVSLIGGGKSPLLGGFTWTIPRGTRKRRGSAGSRGGQARAIESRRMKETQKSVPFRCVGRM